MKSPFECALQAWLEKLGTGSVLSQPEQLRPYEENVSGIKRSVAAVLLPVSTLQVQEIVQIANEFKQSLYPISCGKNWGLGSRLPVTDHCVIVDLHRMNKIHEISEDFSYAVVEPGVTQRQLYDEMSRRNLPMIMNVIGSGLDTSLLGNALERGIGYFASRADSLSGMEVVLGNGDIVKTGFGHYDGAACQYTYRHGIGPGIQDLFHQSNFGIVTSASIDLIPWTDEHITLVAKIDNESKLPLLADALMTLRRRDVFRMVVHIGNRHRLFSTLAPSLYLQIKKDHPDLDDAECRKEAVHILEKEHFGVWSAVAGVSGTPEVVKSATKEFRRALRGIAGITVLKENTIDMAGKLFERLSFIPVFKRKRRVLNAMAPIARLASGIPTDEALRSMYWASSVSVPDQQQKMEPDEDECGYLFCLPLFPGSGSNTDKVVRAVGEVFDLFGFKPNITINLLDIRNMEAVISLAFKKSDAEQVNKAHACNEAMIKKLIELGFPPYRVGVQEMNLVINESDPFWQTVLRIKNALDPNGIISPGRYGIQRPAN